jgi:hypothetical protein
MLGSGERHTGWLENGFPIRTGAGNVGLPCLVTDGQGGIIVGWSDTRQPLPGTYALRLSGDGQIAAGWTPNGNLVATKSPFPPGVFEMASDGAGGAYFALMAATDPQGFEDIYASRINGDGQRPPGWPLSGVPVSTLPLTQSWLTACEDGVGGVYLAWGDFGYDVGVKMQHLLADGMRAPGWGELGIAPVDHFDFQTPRGLVPDGAGGVFVLVQVSSGPYYDYLQHLTGAGTPVSGWPGTGVILTTAGSPYDGQITPDGAGGVIAVWNDSRNGFQYQLYAQRFKGGVITSVQLSLVSAEAEPNRVRLTWQGTGAANLAARVERRDEIGTWLPLGVPTSDGSDRLRFEDASVSPGTRYAYRLGYVEDGAERFTEETWVEVPRAFELALDGFRPNPAAGVPTISFTLASASVARLEVLDVAGRRVAERDLISFGPGRHSIRLDSAAALCPGVYLVRLAQGDRVLRARGIVSR